jgi:hypothetical protein
VLGAIGDGLHLGDATQSTSRRDGQRALAELYWERLSFTHPYQSSPAPGWTADLFAWTYYLGTTFLVPNQYAARFSAGTKLRWSESGVVKYGVVTEAVLTGTQTAVALAPTNDYAMAANPDPGSNWYSYESPPDFPAKFSFTPALTGITGQTVLGFWSIAGNGLTTISLATFTSGTGSATTFTLTNLPFYATQDQAAPLAIVLDNTSFVTAQVSFSPSSQVATFLKNGNGGTWTASGIRSITSTFGYW